MVRLKVLMIYPMMRDFHWYRYENQIRAIAKNVDYLYILYWVGYRPDREGNIIFIKTKRNYPLRIWNRIPKFPTKARHQAINIAKNLPDIDFDVMYVMSGSPIFQYMYKIIAEQKNIPMVMRLRGDGRAERKVHIKEWWKRTLYNYYDDQVMEYADLIIPITGQLKDRYAYDPKYLTSDIVPIGVDANQFPYTKLPTQFAVGYIGRISKEKGIDFLIQLMKVTPEIKYIVAGEKQIDVTFPKNVEYLGLLKHPNMNEVYDKVSMVLIPSDFEGLSNVILESYSKGRPILATPQAVAKEIPIFGWTLSRDIPAWKNIILSWYHQRRMEFPESNEWIMNNLSWETFGKEIVDNLKTVVRRKTEWSERPREMDTIWTRTEHIPEYRVRMIRLIERELGNNPQWNMLDAGCGTGLTYQYLSDEFKSRYFGIDFTKEMVDHCIDKYQTMQFATGDLRYPKEIPLSNLIITQNVIQHNTLWMYVLQNLIDKAKNCVIFCERTHEDFTVKVGDQPTRYKFNINDFIQAMEYCGKGNWDKPEILGHPKSTEGLPNVLTIFRMRKR